MSKQYLQRIDDNLSKDSQLINANKRKFDFDNSRNLLSRRELKMLIKNLFNAYVLLHSQSKSSEFNIVSFIEKLTIVFFKINVFSNDEKNIVVKRFILEKINVKELNVEMKNKNRANF